VLVAGRWRHVLTQSLAIMEYLDEAYPESAILPWFRMACAGARASLAIACEIAPCVSRPLNFLTGR